MTLQEERLQVLKMLEDGQISADEAAKLLAAIETGSQKTKRSPNTSPAGGSVRWLRVRVEDGPRTKVNVNLPIGLVNVGLKLGSKFVPEMEGLDMEEIRAEIDEAIQSGAQGKIVEIEDEETRVEVFIE